MLDKINKNVFGKLYRYYCRKLLSQWVMILLMFFLSLWILGGGAGLVKEVNRSQSWTEYLTNFWLISFLQLFALFMIVGQLVSKLVGLYYSGGLFSRYKKSSVDDITVLNFTPRINRETLILAKFATIFTYFFLINFLLLTLPLALYFLVFSSLSLSWISVLSFSLLNGLVFVFINFLLIIPFTFYFYENYSFLPLLMFFLFITILSVFIFFFREIFFQYPLLFPLLSVPLSVIVGYLFFSLYQKKFLNKDLD